MATEQSELGFWFNGSNNTSDRPRELAEAIANVLADAADTLGLMHVTVDGDRVYAYHVWTGPELYADRVLAFTVKVD